MGVQARLRIPGKAMPDPRKFGGRRRNVGPKITVVCMLRTLFGADEFGEPLEIVIEEAGKLLLAEMSFPGHFPQQRSFPPQRA